MIDNLPETRRHVNGHILVPFFKTFVFFHIVKVVTANNNGPLHFHFHDSARQNTSANVDITSERAFFVNVVPFNGLKLKKHSY